MSNTINMPPSTENLLNSFSLTSIFRRFKWRISLTFTLVLVEALLDILYPLFIGWAINDLLNESYQGIYLLVGLGTISLIIGSLRRFYDTRIYSGIYQKIAPEMVQNEKQKKQKLSIISARTSLLTEFVEFLENSMPEVIASIVGLIGILLIVSTLNIQVFIACIGLLLLITVIYLLTGNWNYQLNAHYNEELEKQVNELDQPDEKRTKKHFQNLMNWNIKLSDLETGNYFFIWLGVIALFIYTPIAAIDSGAVNYGLVFSLLMYVFDYIEKTSSFPLYVQQLIRLREITHRMQNSPEKQ